MIELLTTMSVTQILIYAFMIAVAVKEGWKVVDFFRQKISKKYEKNSSDDQKIKDIIARLDAIDKNIKDIKKSESELCEQFAGFKEECIQHFKRIDMVLAMLKESDKDDIKSWIVERHHFFMHQEWIDDFSMDTVERRFAHYKEEGGNSYIENLVRDLRKLPNEPER